MRDEHEHTIDHGSSGLNRPDLLREAQAARADERARTDWQVTFRRRLLVIGAVLAVWVVGIQGRLVHLQVVNHDDLFARAERQRGRTLTVPPKRGDLLDRYGHVLAYSVNGHAVYAEPPLVENPEQTAQKICAALDGCSPQDEVGILDRLRRQKSFQYVWRRASPADAARVLALKLPGVGVLNEARRYYPNRELGAHVLGYVSLDNEGLGGIESAYNDRIAGHPGRILLQTDGKVQAFGRIERPPTVGATLELTLDRDLQHIAERELEAGVAEYGAVGGTVIMMDPRSGEVLAMANWPTFNPNRYQDADAAHRRNRGIQEIYEPGSTFKIVTASGALEEHLVKPDDTIDVSAGYIRFGSRQIEDVHRYGPLSFEDVIVKSSNVGAIKVGLRLGAERLSDYVRRFGFGQAIARDLPGQSRGIVYDAEHLGESALASVSMGYQVGVTPIQMATAASTIANGGQLLEPRLVRAIITGNQRVEVPGKVIRRAVSSDTAAQLTAIMEAVVERGTAKAAKIHGYTIAGKTGTAAKLEDGRYSKSDYNASFVGFIPSRDPALTILVVIDSPHGKGYYGGAVAAPIFKRIAEAALRQLGIPPNVDPSGRLLVAQALDAPTNEQVPTPARALLGVAAPRSFTAGVMPDLRGMSARDAVQALAQLGVAVQLLGDGLVVEQQIPPGEAFDRGVSCVLRLARHWSAAQEPRASQ